MLTMTCQCSFNIMFQIAETTSSQLTLHDVKNLFKNVPDHTFSFSGFNVSSGVLKLSLDYITGYSFAKKGQEFHSSNSSCELQLPLKPILHHQSFGQKQNKKKR